MSITAGGSRGERGNAPPASPLPGYLDPSVSRDRRSPGSGEHERANPERQAAQENESGG